MLGSRAKSLIKHRSPVDWFLAYSNPPRNLSLGFSLTYLFVSLVFVIHNPAITAADLQRSKSGEQSLHRRRHLRAVAASTAVAAAAVAAAGDSKIRKMDLEAMSVQPSANGSLLAYQTSKEELLESGLADTLSVSADQRTMCDRRTMFVMSIERFDQPIERIVDDRGIMLETEGPGALLLQGFLDTYNGLDPLILHLLDTYNMQPGGGGNIRKSNNIRKSRKSKKILGVMSKRMDKNKWIIISIILVLVLAIILIVYFKLAS